MIAPMNVIDLLLLVVNVAIVLAADLPMAEPTIGKHARVLFYAKLKSTDYLKWSTAKRHSNERC